MVNSAREWSMEDWEALEAAENKLKELQEACAEEGGPCLSLVPCPTSVPTLGELDDISQTDAASGESCAVPFTPEPTGNARGWTAARQRGFIKALAETGSVHTSAKYSGLTARSAYALRVRSPAFAAAWNAAQQLAVGRLSALAFDRAINGRIEAVFHDGILTGEKRVPSDRLLMWLLSRLDPKRFAFPWERGKDDADPQAEAQQAFASNLDALTDTSAY